MPIKKVKIKNFRSLREAEVVANNLTVLVGCNDEGKSNVLRALDLFFNGDQRGAYQLSWQRDFCVHAKVPLRKAPEIEIKITFELPSSFSVEGDVEWTRIWRQTGIHRDIIALEKGGELPPRSKAYAFLKSIRYDYVPAIKGPEYFERLLENVHDMLDATVRSDIRGAAAGFTKEIRKHTSGILADLQTQLGLKSEIELPTDLRRLFSELEFHSEVGAYRLALSQRGDGVKVRHIPVILRWLATQANHLSAPGRPKVVTIWGYEEPENNLETKRCFELADFFVGTSDQIQIFLTSHSPVFYAEFRNPERDVAVSVVEVQLDAERGSVLIPRIGASPADVDALHSSIGFLDLIEPHVRHWKQQAAQLQTRLDEGLDVKYPTIFVEGPTDRTILQAGLKKFFPQAGIKIISSSVNGGGHGWVKDSLIAWQHCRATARAVGLFDRDKGADASVQEFKKLVEDRCKSPRAFKHRLKAAGPALELAKMRLDVPIAIEEICPREIWLDADANGWLEERPGLTTIYGFNKTDMTFNDWMADTVTDTPLRLIATRRVKMEFKERFAGSVAKQLTNQNCSLDLEPVRLLLDTLLEKVLGKDQ